MKYFVHDWSSVFLDIPLDFESSSLQYAWVVVGSFMVFFLVSWGYNYFTRKPFSVWKSLFSHLGVALAMVGVLLFVRPESLSLRYYGFLFGGSIFLSWLITKKLFQQRNYTAADLDSFIFCTVVGGIIGLRLGHVLFYNPGYYFEDPVRILKVWEGGLASHGALIGVVVGAFVFARQKGYPFLGMLDICVLGGAHGGIFVRLGNFMNSEIVGKPSELPWAVVFMEHDYPELLRDVASLPQEVIARHPSQLYEALFSLCIILVLLFLNQKYRQRLRMGVIVSLYFMVYAVCRFLVEFVKEPQTLTNSALTMGQYLSVPFFLFGVLLWWRLHRKA